MNYMYRQINFHNMLRQPKIRGPVLFLQETMGAVGKGNSLFTSMATVLLRAQPCNDGIVSLKVIPLKLFYYQTFFETWHNQYS